MRIFKKRITALFLAGSVALASSLGVYACNKTSGCGSTSQKVVCTIAMAPSSGGTHIVTEETGYTEVCHITYGGAVHMINCTGCGYAYPNEWRTCQKLHSYKYCAPTYNMCQYNFPTDD